MLHPPLIAILLNGLQIYDKKALVILLNGKPWSRTTLKVEGLLYLDLDDSIYSGIMSKSLMLVGYLSQEDQNWMLGWGIVNFVYKAKSNLYNMKPLCTDVHADWFKNKNTTLEFRPFCLVEKQLATNILFIRMLYTR